MSIVRKILGLPEYQPLNFIQIFRENLLQNYKVLSEVNKKVKIAPVLKSNAYGHGLTLVAKILDSIGRAPSSLQNDIIPFFCVDSLYEAYELLKAKTRTPILIMGYTHPENLKVKKLPFSFAISTLDIAQAISKYQPQVGVHIFVDTGINREGVLLSELPSFLKSLPKNLRVEGLMSHLASGELPSDPQTKLQIKNFQKAQQIVNKFGFHPKWIHLSNSGGALNNLNPGCTMARTGIALYGINPCHSERSEEYKLNHTLRSTQGDRLKPVLQLKTKLIQIKTLEKGQRVGYNGTFTAKKSVTLGILPLGYYDGIDSRLSNRGVVTTSGVECPILGRVSMNITALDISKVKSPGIGQEVIVFSSNPSDKNSVENAARICQTIPYDLLVHTAPATRRVIV